MDAMPIQPAHAKPARRDLIWVLVLIAACGLLEVWASWLQIGALAGFPKLGAMTTGWILPVTTEAYWTAALYAWLVDPAGPKSKLFAMGSGAAVFALSLAGQESDHLLAAAHEAVPPVWVVGFVTALPLIAVALVAVLIHLRQTDRDEAAEVVRQAADEAERIAAEAAAADERTVLRAELETLAAEVEPLREALAEAAKQAEEDALKRAILERKLAAQKTSRARANPVRAKSANARANQAREKDVDARTKALPILAAEPDISGAALGLRVGMSKRWGNLHRSELVAMAADLEGSQGPS